jgi:hypothetical protein
VANLPLRVAVRVHCGHPACAQHDGVHVRVTPAALRLRVLYCTHGYPTGIPLPESTHGPISTQRGMHCRLERPCANTIMCGCRGSSCW